MNIPPFFCAIWYWEYCHNRLLIIEVLYLCAVCHDLYQEGWQQFSCIMVLMVFGILILKSWKVSFFSFFLWFGLVKCFVINVYWQERRMVICHRIAIEVVFFRSEGLLWCQWYKLSSEGK